MPTVDQPRGAVPRELDGRVALITGGAGGLGQAMATALAEQGAAIAVHDLRSGLAEEAAARIRALGTDALSVGGDIADPQTVARAFEAIQSRWGHLDILVNNAGFQHVQPIEDYPLDIWRKMLDVHLTAAFMTTRAAIPGMKARRWGRIVNMSSVNGKIGAAFKSAYCTAKHGIIGLTRVAALELARDGITVNAICPGYSDTPMVRGQLGDLAKLHGLSSDEEVLEHVLYPQIPQRRLMAPEEIAGMVAYLCSERARGITGQAINVSGGLVMH